MCSCIIRSLSLLTAYYFNRDEVGFAVRHTERESLTMIQLRSICILCIHALGTKIHVVQVSVSFYPVVCKNETNNAVYRLLLLINTLQFLLCTTQAILHTVFYFLMFTIITNVPLWLRHVNSLVLSATIIYNITVSSSTCSSFRR